MGNRGAISDKGNGGQGKSYKAGYEYLIAYKLTVPIYDYTMVYIDRWVSPYSRRYSQMEGGARSGHTNLPEGYMQQGRKGYIKLTGVNLASLEELLKDYLAIARQKGLRIWDKDECKGKIREIEKIWGIIRKNKALPDQPNFPDLPENQEVATNLMVTLIHQAIYFQERLIESIKEKHEKEGGLTEELYTKRKNYRGY